MLKGMWSKETLGVYTYLNIGAWLHLENVHCAVRAASRRGPLARANVSMGGAFFGSAIHHAQKRLAFNDCVTRNTCSH